MFGLEQFAFLGIDLVELIKWVGILGVAFIVFAESGLLIGFFLPGDSLIFTAGYLTGVMLPDGSAPILDINVWLLALILWVAAVAGDSVGYTFGHRVGRKLFKREDSMLFSKDNLLRAEAFYERHGGKTIIIARFIPIIRTFAPIVAGISKMHYRNFISYNVFGGLAWAVGITVAGHYLGAWFTSHGMGIDTVLLPLVVIILAISILPPLVTVMKKKENRDNLKKHAKHYYNQFKDKRASKKSARLDKKSK